ncbi:DUF6541 family protein [Geodermatophilus sp. SYSU D00525]
MSDRAVLAVGLLLLYLPGALLFVVCRVRSLKVWLGAAPAATLGVYQLAALAGPVVGVRLWPAATAVVAALAVVAVVLEVRARRSGVVPDVVRSALGTVTSRPLTVLAGVLGVATACWLATTSWLRGLAGLATPLQEHDPVQHLLLTAFVARTGDASPFDVMPLDLATGGNVRFYPAGLHTFAGLLAGPAPDPVVAFNAAVVLLLGVAAPLTLAAAVAAVAGRRYGVPAGALAALTSSVLYRPQFQLAHDAGIFAFGVGLALAPAAVVCLLGLRSGGRGLPVVTAVVALGLYAIHPSIAVIVVIALVAGGVAALTDARARRWIGDTRWALLATAVLSAVLVTPWLLASLRVGGQVTDYPEVPPLEPFPDAVERVVGARYGGFLDPTQTHHQTAFAVLALIGLLGCLTQRRLLPLAAAWLAWLAIAIGFTTGLDDAPVLEQIGGLFYNSTARLTNTTYVLAAAVAGAGIAGLAARLADLAGWRPRRRATPEATADTTAGATGGGATASGRRLPEVLVPLVAIAVGVTFVLVSALDYRVVNTQSVAGRASTPDFVRVSAEDREAFAWLARQDGVGTVMNNGNDGSTYLYVYEGIPVVNVYPVGVAEARYGIYLMEHFDRIDTDPKVRCLVQRYAITHVFVSLTSPRIGAAAAPFGWVDGPTFDFAPGLDGLDQADDVRLVHRNADASVYAVDRAVLEGDDQRACSADPAAP